MANYDGTSDASLELEDGEILDSESDSESFGDLSMEVEDDEIVYTDSESIEDDSVDERCKDKPVQLMENADFAARPYQLELFKYAKEKNSILVLGTGSGKTFISILLIKEFADKIRGSMAEGNQRTVFVVNTVPLVYQQGAAIERHTGLKVGKYEGSKGVDYWDDERWNEELESHEVLVLTAQIFLELVLHARLPLRQVNLLIMDECHHASGNHPMKEIMREFEILQRSQPEECPRIMGLTASVINCKCKKGSVYKSMCALEKTMSSVLKTSENQQEVIKFTTRPQEIVVVFKKDLSPYQELVNAQLDGVRTDIVEMENVDSKVKKFIIKRIKNIQYILTELGDWCVSRAISYEMDSLEETANTEDIPIFRDLFNVVRKRLQDIYCECLKTESKMGNPRNHVSHHVKRLIELLKCLKGNEVSGLIFVERRNTAKILYNLLLELARQNPDLSFIKPCYIVGHSARPGIDLKLAELELRKQDETLKKFRNGEANFIVSTSVLEEGVDIRKCNVVIRFDKPVTYRAYIQSRGRARAVPSRYILMISDDDYSDFLDEVDIYREIEKILVTLCHNRELPTQEEIQEHFEDEIIPPYEPYGKQGPKVTANSSIALINQYCQRLPQDRFTELTPQVIFNSNDEGLTQAGILLPVSSKLKTCTYGRFLVNIDLAKKSAALQTCEELHKIKELDDNLRPTFLCNENLAEGLLDETLEVDLKVQSKMGTKKHRQIYEREFCESFIHAEDKGPYHLYCIEIQPIEGKNRDVIVDSTQTNETLGIICQKLLVHCPFDLFGVKFGKVRIRMKYLRSLQEREKEEISSGRIQHFHKLALESLLHVNVSLMEYNPEDNDQHVYILPLKGDSINYDLLRVFDTIESVLTNKLNQSSQHFRFEKSTFQDAVIFPLYGEEKEQLYYVTNIIDNLNPRSEFPETKKRYATYEGYFMAKYDIKIRDRSQPLIAAKHLPKELNYLKEFPCKKKSTKEPPYFVPELCGVIPLKASLWWQLSCIPSILYRLNSLGVAFALNEEVRVHSSPGIESITDQVLDFKWAEHIAERSLPRGNLAVELSMKKIRYIHPFMLSHAFTLLGSNDSYNLERLEVLGDSYLKYITGEYVFLMFPNEHEGRLSLRRMALICNRTLYQLGKKNHLPMKIHAVNLQPKENGIIPGFCVKKTVEKELYNLEFPHDRWRTLQVPNNMSDLKQVVVEIKDQSLPAKERKKMARTPCYNPWREQEVSDKSVADCAEALIGAYLLACGSDAAKDFLHWIGIGVFNGRPMLKDALPIPSGLLREGEFRSNTEVNRFYRKACLDRLENIIQYRFKEKAFIVQAMTHPSYTLNRTTDTYQRLEFIGDAVLDYLVTGMIYAKFTSYSPGQMTDLRSYYVNNETLACVSAKYSLQRHMLHMAPKLQASIDKFLTIYKEDTSEREFVLEEDEDDLEEIEVPKSMGDLVEAIIGAVYLDSNRNLEQTWTVIVALMGDVFEKKHDDIPKNCVRELYETYQQVRFKKVQHEDSSIAEYKVKVNGHLEVSGLGKNYKAAKDNAARKALRILREREGPGG